MAMPQKQRTEERGGREGRSSFSKLNLHSRKRVVEMDMGIPSRAEECKEIVKTKESSAPHPKEKMLGEPRSWKSPRSYTGL